MSASGEKPDGFGGVAWRCEKVAALIPDAEAYAREVAQLPAWRRRKLDGLHFAEDRRRSVAAWILLREMLKDRGVRAAELAVCENAFGKPELPAETGLHFSISHAGERVMVAVADRPVGCDVERVAPVDEDVWRVCLSPDELAAVRAQPTSAARDRAFCRLWVRKEARAKADGRGLGDDPRAISTGADDARGGCEDFDFGDGHVGAVAFLWYNAESVVNTKGVV